MKFVFRESDPIELHPAAAHRLSDVALPSFALSKLLRGDEIGFDGVPEATARDLLDVLRVCVEKGEYAELYGSS
jgi:hypothetical protein